MILPAYETWSVHKPGQGNAILMQRLDSLFQIKLPVLPLLNKCISALLKCHSPGRQQLPLHISNAPS